mmetsp:Transcript_7146/g.19757  ORF Transcript_7146/g.19757 Transcript_7146/m.19757 type:complete len:250 (-) Transcript_7146:259-1008(-)
MECAGTVTGSQRFRPPSPRHHRARASGSSSSRNLVAVARLAARLPQRVRAHEVCWEAAIADRPPWPRRGQARGRLCRWEGAKVPSAALPGLAGAARGAPAPRLHRGCRAPGATGARRPRGPLLREAAGRGPRIPRTSNRPRWSRRAKQAGRGSSSPTTTCSSGLSPGRAGTPPRSSRSLRGSSSSSIWTRGHLSTRGSCWALYRRRADSRSCQTRMSSLSSTRLGTRSTLSSTATATRARPRPNSPGSG